MSIRITAYNRGPEPADLHIVPQLWFRNTWSWPKERPIGKDMPNMKAKNDTTVQIDHATLGRMYCHLNESPGPIEPIKRGARGSAGGPQQPIVTEESVAPEMLFTHNDTNFQRLYGGQNQVPYVKDAFHDHIIMSHRPPLPKSEQPDNGEIIAPVAEEAKPEGKVGGDDMDPARTDVEKPPTDPSPTTPKARIDMDGQPAATAPQPPTPKWPDFVNPDKEGTKFGAHYTFKQVPANGGCCVVRLKLTDKDEHEDEACYDEEMFDEVIQERRLDADEFYSRFNSGNLTDDLRNIMRQALAGMLWNKQFYYFIQKEWLQGDPGQPPPPPERQFIRNRVSLFDDSPHRDCDLWRLMYARPFLGLATPSLRGHSVYARQVGVPLLCCLGYGFPLSSPRDGRSGICQEPAHAHGPGVVHEAGRSAARLRVEVSATDKLQPS
jgi:hypothetical protein